MRFCFSTLPFQYMIRNLNSHSLSFGLEDALVAPSVERDLRTEAVSSLRWPWVRFHPVALCCMSCPLSPSFPVHFSAVMYKSKDPKAPPKNLQKVLVS